VTINLAMGVRDGGGIHEELHFSTTKPNSLPDTHFLLSFPLQQNLHASHRHFLFLEAHFLKDFFPVVKLSLFL
jgi:hypothetical protein